MDLGHQITRESLFSEQTEETEHTEIINTITYQNNIILCYILLIFASNNLKGNIFQHTVCQS